MCIAWFRHTVFTALLLGWVYHAGEDQQGFAGRFLERPSNSRRVSQWSFISRILLNYGCTQCDRFVTTDLERILPLLLRTPVGKGKKIKVAICRLHPVKQNISSPRFLLWGNGHGEAPRPSRQRNLTICSVTGKTSTGRRGLGA